MSSSRARERSRRRARWYSVRLLLAMILLLPLLGVGVLAKDKYDVGAQFVADAEELQLRAVTASRLAVIELMLEAEVLVEPIQAALVPLGLDMRTLNQVIESDVLDDSLTLIRELADDRTEVLELDDPEGPARVLGQQRIVLLNALNSLPVLRAQVDAGEMGSTEARAAFRELADLVGNFRSEVFQVDRDIPSGLSAQRTVAVALSEFEAMQLASLEEIYGTAVTDPRLKGIIEAEIAVPDNFQEVVEAMVLVDYHRGQFEAIAPESALRVWRQTEMLPSNRQFGEIRERIPVILGVTGDAPDMTNFDSTEYGQLGFASLIERTAVFDALIASIVNEASVARTEAADEQRQTLYRSAAVALVTLLGGILAAAALQLPLRQVQRRAASISRGELGGTPLGAMGPNEVATIALTMDDLDQTLGSLQAQLAALAQERTETPRSLLPGALGSLMTKSIDRVETLRDAMVEQARTDRLTSLPNRRATVEELDRLIATAGATTAVLFADLDRFKTANDKYGHAMGDSILACVARRFADAIGDHGWVGRIGGDEFLVVSHVATSDEAIALGNRLISALHAPVAIERLEFDVGVSVGVTVSQDETVSASSLLREADLALYAAKGTSAALVVCTDELLQEATLHREIASDLERALSNDELTLEIQPLVDLRTGSVSSGEALCRWERNGSQVSPGRFIPVAEDVGLIVALDRWVLSEGTRHARVLMDAGTPLPIAINISWRHLIDGNLYDDVVSALELAGLPPHLLRLELTESVQPSRATGAEDELRKIRALGVGLSLDDFGTGFSSITHLRRFPFDAVKIDRSLVADAHKPAGRALVDAVVELCRNLDLQVVGEGVETAADAELLTELGCGTGQGWLWSPSLSLDAFVDHVVSTNTRNTVHAER